MLSFLKCFEKKRSHRGDFEAKIFHLAKFNTQCPVEQASLLQLLLFSSQKKERKKKAETVNNVHARIQRHHLETFEREG